MNSTLDRLDFTRIKKCIIWQYNIAKVVFLFSQEGTTILLCKIILQDLADLALAVQLCTSSSTRVSGLHHACIFWCTVPLAVWI